MSLPGGERDSAGPETPSPADFTVFLGRVGSTEIVEFDQTSFVTSPEGFRGISGLQISRLTGIIDDETIVWWRADAPAPPEDPDRAVDVLAGGRLVLDRGRREVRLDDQHIHLTAKEYEVLDLLVRNKGQVILSTTMLSTIWDYEYDSSKTLVVHVKRVRDKLGDLGAAIHTKRAVGYMFDDSEEAMAANVTGKPKE